MAERIAPDLDRALRGNPETRLEVVVTAAGGLDELMAALPKDLQVDHTYRLINGVAVTGRAGSLARLAKSPAVKSMESVRTVRSQ